jgi:hypothetical protein
MLNMVGLIVGKCVGGVLGVCWVCGSRTDFCLVGFI